MGGEVTITVQVTPRAAGLLTNAASVATSSTDSNAANNSSNAAIQVYFPVTIDVQPGSSLNSMNTSKKGLVPVAILTTAEFDASALSVVTACFGDAEAPSQRNCTDAHGGPRLADVDRDRDLDLLFHYEVLLTGIDFGDTRACLIGTFANGTGFYGCDTIRTVK